MNEYAILSIHGAIILFGVLLMTPMGSGLAAMFAISLSFDNHTSRPNSSRHDVCLSWWIYSIGPNTVDAQQTL